MGVPLSRQTLNTALQPTRHFLFRFCSEIHIIYRYITLCIVILLLKWYVSLKISLKGLSPQQIQYDDLLAKSDEFNGIHIFCAEQMKRLKSQTQGFC